MVNFSHTSGYLGVMQLVYSILLPSGYVGAAYVLKIRNNIQVLLFSYFLSENVRIPSLSAPIGTDVGTVRRGSGKTL